MKSFVIFGMGRTGSSLLVSLLNSHPQIHCDGELFNPDRWRRPLRPLSIVWHHFPFPYLVYRQERTCHWRQKGRRQKEVYGFKLHDKITGSQLADTEAFLHLIARKGWQIIHLKRTYLFDQLLSSLVAIQTKRYFGHPDRPEPQRKIVIPIDTFHCYMERIFTISLRNQQILNDIPHLTLTYEADLADNRSWNETIARVCDFLDIASAPTIKSRVLKPWSRPYSEIVLNYAELQIAFQEYEVQLVDAG